MCAFLNLTFFVSKKIFPQTPEKGFPHFPEHHTIEPETLKLLEMFSGAALMMALGQAQPWEEIEELHPTRHLWLVPFTLSEEQLEIRGV